MLRLRFPVRTVTAALVFTGLLLVSPSELDAGNEILRGAEPGKTEQEQDAVWTVLNIHSLKSAQGASGICAKHVAVFVLKEPIKAEQRSVLTIELLSHV